MEPEVVVSDNKQRPRWNPTIKVVVGVLMFVLFALSVYAFRIILVPLVIGAVMAYVLQPVVRLIGRITRLPHGIATGLLYLTLLALVIPVGAILTPLLIDQIIYLRGELIRFTRYLDTISADTTMEILGFELGVRDLVAQITSALTSLITAVAPESLTVVLGAARTLLLTVFTFVIGFYLTRDAKRIVAWLHGLTPSAYRRDMEALMTEIDGIWSAFFRGQVFLSLLVTAILTILSAILGLPQPFLLGIWGGLLEFMPSIGNTIWGITVVTVALLGGSSYLPLPNAIFALVVFGAYVAFAQLDINVLIPNIIGRQVRLHPVVVILGVIIGASVGGVLGVALAAPTIASLRVIGRYIYANLFDLDPFPMVGPPSAPRAVREAEAERLTATAPSVPSSPDAVIERVRSFSGSQRLRKRFSAREADVDETKQ